jgi:UDP-N-acetyl-D-glucosamine dehydrogenase
MKSFHYNARFIELASEINTNMPRYVVARILDSMNERGMVLKGSRCLVLGAAYKPNIDDLRESPALDIILLLQKLGAKLSYSDPHIPTLKLDGLNLESQDLAAAAKQADCVVIVTDHSTFNYTELLESAQLIIDTRNAMKRFQSDKIVRL